MTAPTLNTLCGLRMLAILALSLAAGACVPAHVKTVQTGATDDLEANDRAVLYHTSPAYYRNAPDCVIVAPMGGNSPAQLNAYVERNVARQLTGKVERVIDPLRRDRAVHELAYDLNHAEDFASFARHQRCGYAMNISLQGSGDQFAVIWSDKRVGVKMELIKVQNKEVLWRGAHVARRGNGGVPLSPLSVLTSAAAAVSFSTDQGVVYSIANDAVRRILTTLPDIR